MSTFVITPEPDTLLSPEGPREPSATLDDLAALATWHHQLVPVRLVSQTRRSISTPLNLALLFAGRAQPTLNPTERRTQRSDIGRLQVALHDTRQDLVLLGSQHLHPADVDLFHTATTEAGVDLWLVPDHAPTQAHLAAIARAQGQGRTPVLAARTWRALDGHDQRRRPSLCEAALPVGSSTSSAPGCTRHQDAGGCVLASFGDALIAARLEPVALRTRLHELSRTLPEHSAWNVRAAARDPYPFLDRALGGIDVRGENIGALTIGSLSPNGDKLRTRAGTVDVPPHLRGVLTAHRDIRVAEGSTPDRPFCIPTDDGTRPRSRVR